MYGKKTFWKLHKTIYNQMGYNIRPPTKSKKRWKNGAKYGLITSTVRLSCAIRYFAGGSPYDIAIAHGISVREVYTSVWRTVDAVNKTTALNISLSLSLKYLIYTFRHVALHVAMTAMAHACTNGWQDCEVPRALTTLLHLIPVFGMDIYDSHQTSVQILL